MIELTIGRNKSNDIIIQDASVSGCHALLIVDEGNNSFNITDNNSTNGTKINNVTILQSAISVKDQLTIGNYKVENNWFWSTAKNAHFQKKTDFTKEYILIFKQFAEYQKAKDRIINPSKLPLFLKIVMPVIIVILILTTNIFPDKMKTGLITICGALFSIPLLFTTSQTKKTEKLDMLKLKYEDVLICPKCKSKLIFQSLTYWKAKSKCLNEKCNAVFKV